MLGIPSQFAWTKPQTESIIKRAERANKRLHFKNVIHKHKSQNTDSVEEKLQHEVSSDIEISANEVKIVFHKKYIYSVIK